MDTNLPTDFPNEIKEFWEKRGYRLSEMNLPPSPCEFEKIIMGTAYDFNQASILLIKVAIYDDAGNIKYSFNNLLEGKENIYYSEEEAISIIRNYSTFL